MPHLFKEGMFCLYVQAFIWLVITDLMMRLYALIEGLDVDVGLKVLVAILMLLCLAQAVGWLIKLGMTDKASALCLVNQ